jgi:hypothetical protein
MEDRASTFEYLMVRPDELCEFAAQDAVLARKVRLLWQRPRQVDGADRLGITAPCVQMPSRPAKKHGRDGKRPLKLRLDAAP